MRESSFKLCSGFELPFHRANEPVQPANRLDPFLIAHSRARERTTQNSQRLVVRLQRDGKGMADFPPCANENRAGSEKRIGAP